MIVIGLTGGIGSGKSTVSRRLLAWGYPLVDADRIARDIVAPGMPALEEIRQRFGDAYLDEEGALRRKELAALINRDPAAREDLDALMHRRIIGQIEEEVAKAQAEGQEVLFLDVPLLFEVGLDRLCRESWLVTAPEDVRIARVMARDGISEELIRGYMANQMPEEEKQRRADRLLDNGGSREELYRQLEEALEAAGIAPPKTEG